MLALVCALQSRWLTRSRWRCCRRRGQADQAGQAVAEYALVLLGAGAIALLVFRWAGATDRIDVLLDGVVDTLLHKVK